MATRPAMREGESQRRLSSNAALMSARSERTSWYWSGNSQNARMVLARVSTVVSAAADSKMPTSRLASCGVISPRSAASYMAMPRLPGVRFSRLQHWLAQAATASVFSIASWNNSFGGPIVAHTMLPKAYMCSRPCCGSPIRSGSTL